MYNIYSFIAFAATINDCFSVTKSKSFFKNAFNKLSFASPVIPMTKFSYPLSRNFFVNTSPFYSYGKIQKIYNNA